MTSANLLRPLSHVPTLAQLRLAECEYYASRSCRRCKGKGVVSDGKAAHACPRCVALQWKAAQLDRTGVQS